MHYSELHKRKLEKKLFPNIDLQANMDLLDHTNIGKFNSHTGILKLNGEKTMTSYSSRKQANYY